MLLEIILFLALGIIAGTFTGLIPGIHINLIGGLLISLPLAIINPLYFVVFITSMSITHTFIDFIPSVLVGCPDTDTELGTLPGHKLLQEGKGYEAIYLTNKGSITAIFILLIISIPSFILIKNSYTNIKPLIPWILILVSTALILTENKKLDALKIFLLTGFLGYATTTLDINQPLLPLLTGLFGSSILINSIRTNPKIPKQKITQPKIKMKKPIFASIVSAPLCSFLPGLGSGQAAIIGNLFIKEDEKTFLFLLGIINTLVMGFSMITLFAIQKTRTGTASFIKNILPSFDLKYLILIFVIILITGFISFNLTNLLAKFFVKKIEKINYKKLALITLLILTIIVILVSGIIGLIVFILSSLTGLYASKFKIRRTNMMGSLMIPSILWGLNLIS